MNLGDLTDLVEKADRHGVQPAQHPELGGPIPAVLFQNVVDALVGRTLADMVDGKTVLILARAGLFCSGFTCLPL